MSGLGLLTAVLLILPTLIAAYLGRYAWRRRMIPGATSFALMMLVVAGWCGTAALVVVNPEPGAARFWLKMLFTVTPFLPVCILATAAHTTENAALVRPTRLALWLVVPVLTAILSVTSDAHHHFLYTVRFVQSGPQNIGWTNDYGVWWMVHLAYSYGLVLYSAVLLLQQFTRIRFRVFRIRIILLMVGMLLPLFANVFSLLVTDVRYFTTPIMFNLSAPVLFWVMFRFRLFELAPIARDQAFEHMDDPIIIVDPENQIVDINASAVALAQQPVSAIIARPLLQAFSSYARAFSQVLYGSSHHGSIQVDVGGKQQYFDLHVTPITREHEPIGKLIVLRNMTEQRLAEARAREIEIEHERMRTVSQFIEAASHEFRTPLTVIKNSASLISRTDDPAKRRDKTAQIDEQVNLLTQLVEGLLTVVKLNAELEMTLHTLDINTIVQAVEKKLRAEIEAKTLRLEMSLMPHLPTVLGNPGYLQDAFYAILHNAMRYTPTDGTIWLRTAHQDGQVLVSVQDTGIGIPPEQLPHIFDVFYRGDTARSTPGFGTGLAIANRVIALHGGHIDANSQVGVGTTIQVWLIGAQR